MAESCHVASSLEKTRMVAFNTHTPKCGSRTVGEEIGCGNWSQFFQLWVAHRVGLRCTEDL